ncbi:hypothetical protein BD413DRAFT_466892 [Trametes elegans]|nr:hypothetical protein BD413DRAFT_466892 [Trametes elegans]
MPLRIGSIRPYDDEEVIHISHSQETTTLQTGDVVETFDHVFEWDDDCVPLDVCESWRNTGDSLCDFALRQTFSDPSASVGKDLLRTLQQTVTEGEAHLDAVQEFLNEVQLPPPTGILASEAEVALAQEFFLDNSIQIMQALLHYSLAGGFASPRIVRTLEAVSYLVPHVRRNNNNTPTPTMADILACISKASSDRTLSRLLETFQFVLDVMGCSTPLTPSHCSAEIEVSEDTKNRISYMLPEGEGWRSAVRVRLLHGVARWRAEERWRAGGIEQGVPISQEDLAATLASFSTIPIWCLHRLGLPPPPAQASAYLALWRHVGYYLGISPKILLRYFGSTQTADKFLATAALHLFSDSFPSSHTRSSGSTLFRGPTLPILVAVSKRAPLNTSLEYNIALTAHLLGPSLSARLALPHTSLSARLRIHAFLLAQRIPHHFARWYPRGAWREKRRAVLREGMVRTVLWNLGLRRTAFRPRTAVQDGVSTGGDGGSGSGGELAPGVSEAENVRLDPARSRELTRMWAEMWKELVVVCVAACGLAGVFGYVGLRHIILALS